MKCQASAVNDELRYCVDFIRGRSRIFVRGPPLYDKHGSWGFGGCSPSGVQGQSHQNADAYLYWKNQDFNEMK